MVILSVLVFEYSEGQLGQIAACIVQILEGEDLSAGFRYLMNMRGSWHQAVWTETLSIISKSCRCLNTPIASHTTRLLIIIVSYTPTSSTHQGMTSWTPLPMSMEDESRHHAFKCVSAWRIAMRMLTALLAFSTTTSCLFQKFVFFE